MKAFSVTLAFVALSSLALASTSVPRPEPQTLECRRLGAICQNSTDCCSGHCTVQSGGHWHCGD